MSAGEVERGRTMVGCEVGYIAAFISIFTRRPASVAGTGSMGIANTLGLEVRKVSIAAVASFGELGYGKDGVVAWCNVGCEVGNAAASISGLLKQPSHIETELK